MRPRAFRWLTPSPRPSGASVGRWRSPLRPIATSMRASHHLMGLAPSPAATTASAAARVSADTQLCAQSRTGWQRSCPRGYSALRRPLAVSWRPRSADLVSLFCGIGLYQACRRMVVSCSRRGRDASTRSMGLFGGSVTCTDRYGNLFRSTDTYNRDITRRALSGVYISLAGGARTP